ncbi:hypothetical protein QBC45DRAFT_313326, partial [Copromyces sp. CBS 386.78]
DPAIISSKLRAPPQEQPTQPVESSVLPTRPWSASTSTTADSKVEFKPHVNTADQRKHVFGHHGRMKPEWQEAMKVVLGLHGDR